MYTPLRWALAALVFIFVLTGVAPLAASAASRDDDEGTLKVYVEVENRNNYDDLDPEDFRVFIDARSPSKNHFRGDEDGTSVYFEGDYRVYVYGHTNYEADYSSGCRGDLDEDETRTCRVTMEGSRYGTPYKPTYPHYTQPQPITYVQTYVPRFPNTGFEPVDAAALAFAAVLLLGAGVYLYPYVRKTFASVLS